MRTWRDTWSEEELKEYEEEDEEIRSYCKKCLDRGYEILMGPKILMPGEKRDSDYENWKMCPKCYDVIPTHELPKEETIKDTVETQESPFDNKFQLETIPKRYTKAGKKLSQKKRNKKIKLDDDPEIEALLRIYGDRVNVLKN